MRIILPTIDEISRENKPKTQIFICPIEAYAIILFISTCIEADIEVKITETIHKRHTKILKKIVAFKKKGINILIKPYAPIFSKIAAKITEPSVGDSTCASGNHKCKGSIGIFTLNAIKKDSHSKYSYFSNTQYHSNGIIVVPVFIYRIKILININKEPEIV